MVSRTEWREPEKYWIDPKLKKGKDYPSKLEIAIRYFIEKSPTLIWPGKSPSAIRRAKRNLSKMREEVKAAEKIFRKLFLSSIAVKDPWSWEVLRHTRSPRDFLDTEGELTSEGLASPHPPSNYNLIGYSWDPGSIARINRKLGKCYPRLVPDGRGGLIFSSVALKASRFSLLVPLWNALAVLVNSKGGLDPKLVHECPQCQEIFFSRQKRIFHPQCRSKYFSEKAVRDGVAKKSQKLYRDRKKKIVEMEKSP